MNPKARRRLMRLAGIKSGRDIAAKTKPEQAADDYFGMNDETHWDSGVQGFKTLLQIARDADSDENVESLESINKRAAMLYPGKEYKGMYAGERMMESDISKLKDDEDIDLSSILQE